MKYSNAGWSAVLKKLRQLIKVKITLEFLSSI